MCDATERVAKFVELVMQGWSVSRVREGALLGEPGEPNFFVDDSGQCRPLYWNPFDVPADDIEVLRHVRKRCCTEQMNEYAREVCKINRIRCDTDFTTQATIAILLERYQVGDFAKAAEAYYGRQLDESTGPQNCQEDTSV